MTSNPSKIIALDLTQLDAISTLCAHYPQLNWDAVKLKESMQQSHVLALGLFVGADLASFVLCTVAAQDAELLLVLTHPHHLRCGYAQKLLRYLFSTLMTQQVSKVFLEVRASNRAAISLYERLGFNQIHVRKDYYPLGSAREDAVIMKLSLSNN